MAEATAATLPGQPIAVVGLACRFPDADDPPTLLETILTGRRAFRRLPPCRIDLADYYSPEPATADATYSTRAALIEGWQFDRAAFRIPAPAYYAADPAHWLALETVARALAGAGFPGGAGLSGDRVGVIIGNSMGGDTSRANAMRLRWPYVRRVVAEALLAAGVPGERAAQVVHHAAARYLAPFPMVDDDTLAASMPGSIASRICGHFGFRGNAHAVDGAGASSLLAVTTACAALTAGDLDIALAGGVDISLDPLELVGLAKTGALATGEMRVYDENPTGYLPGEGCGVVILMRTPDARAADLPVYAEITGWGISTTGQDRQAAADADGHLLALRRAYERAATDPADVQLIEGHGSGTGPDDEAELTALCQLRGGARVPAALGSVKANIGHAKAAAGSAGLIKTVLALGTGIVPPATGISAPHPLLRDGGGSLFLPRSAREWPEGTRIAGVSAMDPGGVSVHLVLRNEPERSSRLDRIVRSLPRIPHAESGRAASPTAMTPRAADGPARTAAYLLHAPDSAALAAVLSRIAEVAPWLCDAELQDLACHLARQTTEQGQARVAIVASTQEQLARLASEALTLLPQLTAGLLAVRPGIFAANCADGRVTLLLSDEYRSAAAGDAQRHDPAAILGSLAALHWLDRLGVRATAAVGSGLGYLAGLAWAGCISDTDATALGALRAEILATAGPSVPGAADSRPADSGADGAARLRAAVEQLKLSPPKRRLISTRTGRELASAREIPDMLCADLLGPQLPGPALSGAASARQTPRAQEALRAGAVGATVLLETGPGRALTAAASRLCRAPAVSLAAGPDDSRDAARAAAALFAAGALSRPAPLLAGRTARPIDIWREQIFITNPCQAVPRLPVATLPAAAQPVAPVISVGARPAAAQPETGEPASTPRAGPPQASPPQAEPAALQGAQRGEPVEASRTTESTGAGQAGGVRDAVTLTVTGPGTTDIGLLPDRTGRHAGVRAAGKAAQPPGPASQPAGKLPATPGCVSELTDPIPAALSGPVAGLAPWVRCFGEELRAPRLPVQPGHDGPWRVRAGGSFPFRVDINDLFGDDPGADRVLAIIGDPADADSCAAAVRAGRDAIGSGRLVAITHEPGLTGFWAALHAEHPSLGITVLRVPPSAAGLRAARQFAAAEPGEYRELVIDSAGIAREPVMVPVEVQGGGPFPLGADDVVLLSRGARGAGLMLAQVLACCGTPVAVIGQPGFDEDSRIVTGLEQLAAAGARIACEVVDVADPAKMDAAMLRVEQRLGPVTAVALAVGASLPGRIAELTEAGVRTRVATEARRLENLLSAIRTDRLRLIVTFGSVAGRYGLDGTGMLAVTSGSLAQRAARVADGISGCRALHVDLPPWSGAGRADQAGRADRAGRGERTGQSGVDPIGVDDASRMLLKILAAPGLPGRLAMHGRAGIPAPAAIGAAALPSPGAGRFADVTLVHYPGVELICETQLSLRTDPYLADYRVDGMPVLPPVMALEAMAEVARALAGRPLRRATAVSMDAPIVIPAAAQAGQALVRICAQRDADTIQVVLRCAESGFGVEHYRAAFGCGEDVAREPQTAPEQSAASDAGAVDGAELYGPMCFASGRFRRIAILPEVTSRSCRAQARGDDDQPWFSTASEKDTSLVLGSPGLADATLHLLQACVPHRRLLPAGCESVTFSGRAAQGAVQIRAVPAEAGDQRDPAQRHPGGAGTAFGITGQRPAAQAPWNAAAAIPQQATSPERAGEADRGRPDDQPGPARPADSAAVAGPADSVLDQAWDIEAIDAAGWPLVIWRGVRMRDAGPLPRDGAWPPALLSIYLERVSAELGLGPDLQVEVAGGQPGAESAPQAAGGPQTAGGPQAVGTGRLAGLTLRVRAAGAAACGWSATGSGQVPRQQVGRAQAEARAQMFSRFLGEPRDTVSARLQAITACLSMSGAPAACPIVVRDIAEDGWVLLSVAGADMVCTVVEISGVSGPVAVALMTGTPRWEPRTSRESAQPGGQRPRQASARS